MAGLGDYIKGKKFELKSGNNPAFKMMGNPEAGDSPITKSPYEQEEEKEKGGGWKKALKVGVSALTGGLDAVYGTGKVVIGSKGKLEKEKKEECKDKDGYVIDCDSPNAVKK